MENKDRVESTKRIESIDVLRGFLMFWLIGGEWLADSLAEMTGWPPLVAFQVQLTHVDWNGLRFYDILFPTFLFVSGMSYPLSVKRKLQQGTSKKKLFFYALKRGLILVVLGMIYNGLLTFNFQELRVASVLGRIGLAGMFASIIYLFTGNRKSRSIWVVALLVGYWLIMRFIPAPDYPGAELYSPEGSIACYIDRMYLPGTMSGGLYDAEGILSTVPAIATALIGIIVGDFLQSDFFVEHQKRALVFLLAAGCTLIIIGCVWNLVFPINKRIWTSSFVCVVAGIGIILIDLLYIIIDVKNIRKWDYIFKIIGYNSIFSYMIGRIGCIHTLSDYLFSGMISCFAENYQSSLKAFCYLLCMCVFLHYMYKKNICVKV